MNAWCRIVTLLVASVLPGPFIGQAGAGELPPVQFKVPNSSETDRRVVVASCSGDRRYSERTTQKIVASIQDVSEGARSSWPLPLDWMPQARTRLWEFSEPKVIVIHFSCFERTYEKADGDADRDRDFLAFLDTMQNFKVRLLVYSRVFDSSPRYLDDLIRHERFAAKYSGRIFTLPIIGQAFPGESPAADERLREKLRQVLSAPD